MHGGVIKNRFFFKTEDLGPKVIADLSTPYNYCSKNKQLLNGLKLDVHNTSYGP